MRGAKSEVLVSHRDSPPRCHLDEDGGLVIVEAAGGDKGEGWALLRKESTTLLLSLEPIENFLDESEEGGLESPEGMEVFLDVSEGRGLES